MRTTIVKHRYVRRANGGHARAVAHVRYIQYRPGEQEKRKFFNADRDQIDGFEVRGRVGEQDGGVVAHKLILSPGVQGVDLKDYTRELMIALQEKKGVDLEYYATEHHNTDHAHVHVVVMGLDKQGQAVRLDPRQDYQFLRFIGDRYIEHYHDLDRYLDQDLKILMKRGFEHDRGDQAYERLLLALSSNKSIEVLDEERRQRRAIGQDQEDDQFSGGRTDKVFRQLLQDLKSAKTCEELDQEKLDAPKPETKEERRLRLIEETPPEERIEADNGKYFTKHHTLEELEAYDEDLRSHQETWLEYEQYQLLWTWIGTKETAGDDYYERESGEPLELKGEKHRKSDDDLHELRAGSNEHRRRLTFRQYTYETQGRMLDTHERLQLTHARNELRKELAAMEENGEDDPERREDILKRLEWLDERAKEFYPIAKKEEKEVDKTKEDDSRSDEKQQDEHSDRDRTRDESTEREESPQKNRDDEKDKEEREEKRESERDDNSADREEDRQRQDEERQLREREEQERREEESQEREREQDERQAQERDEDALRQSRREEDDWRRQQDEEERERDEQAARDREDQHARERQEREAQEREERDTRDREDRDHEEQEARERDETKEREDRQYEEKKEEAERNFRLQQELEKLRHQELEPGRSSGEGSSRLQEKIDQYEQQLSGHKGERYSPGGIDDRFDPLERTEPVFDIDKNVEESWSLEDRVSQDYELDSLLGELDKDEEHERPETAEAAASNMLFGDTGEQVPEFERTDEEQRIGHWEERAFDPELIKEQQDRSASEHELSESEHTLEELAQKQELDAQTLSRVQESELSMQMMIERGFFEGPERDDDEHDRDDDDKNHDDKER